MLKTHHNKPKKIPAAFITANVERTSQFAPLQVERAKKAVAVINSLDLPTTPPTRKSILAQKYALILEQRIAYPSDSLAQLASRNGMSKDRFWALFRRGCELAERHVDGVSA